MLDDAMKMYLDGVLAEIDSPSEPELPQEEMAQEDAGVENSSPDELCLDDLVCEFKPKYLRDHLPIFADADDIIKMRRMFKKRPELEYAERAECEGGCDGCKADSGCSGKESKE